MKLTRSAFMAAAAALFIPRLLPAQAISSGLRECREVFTTPAQTYNLAQAPVPSCFSRVFVNGLLMREGLDYTLAGRILTFTGAEISADPCIQVFYSVLG
jgi:hypothetical protein